MRQFSWLLSWLLMPEQKKICLYQTYFTTDEPVSSFGWALGLDYMTPVGILMKSNVAYNKLLESIDAPGVESRFNSPEYRTNLSVGHHAIITKSWI